MRCRDRTMLHTLIQKLAEMQMKGFETVKKQHKDNVWSVM